MAREYTPTMRVMLVRGPADGWEFTVPGSAWDVRVSVPAVTDIPADPTVTSAVAFETVVYQRAIPAEVVDGAVVFTQDGRPGTESFSETLAVSGHLWRASNAARTRARAVLQRAFDRTAAPFVLTGEPVERVDQDKHRDHVLVTLHGRGLRRRP